MSTIAVTGSASGIGAATAARLAADGHRVIGIDLRNAEIEADLSDPAGRERAVEGVLDRCDGALDGIVPCAGLAALSDRAGGLLASVNYFGTVELLTALRPALAAGTTPSAVVISSNSTTIQPDIPMDLVELCLAGDEAGARARADEVGSFPTYPATKIALARWVRRSAVGDGWIGAGIRLNAIAPGMIETALIEEGRADPMMAPMLAAFPIPVGRGGRAEEMAALIAFLLGPESTFFCGSIVFADGGSDALLRPDDWPAPWQLPNSVRFRGP
jgi:NAD(P)-dependent dehydrogenase (short-subunit alcohol dehydrogenase family)